MTKEYGPYKKPVKGGPMEFDKREEIKEPESRATVKEERYASIGKTQGQEEGVAAPSKIMLEETELPKPGEGKMGGRLKGRDKLPKIGHLPDSINIYNQRKSDWQYGWEHRFNRREEFLFFDWTNAYETGPIWSKKFYCAPYRWALVMFDLANTLSDPTRLLILCWFSYDGVTWFQYMEDAWGRMQWEDTDLPSKEAYPVPILAPWITFTYGITGGEVGAKYFPLKIEAVFNSV